MQRAFSLLSRFGSSFNGEEKRMRDSSPQPFSLVEEDLFSANGAILILARRGESSSEIHQR